MTGHNMKRRKLCFYCDRPTSNPDWDHAPLARRHGGTEVVPACAHCHNLKDRLPVELWSPSELEALERGTSAVATAFLEFCHACGEGQDITVCPDAVQLAASRTTTPEARIAVFKAFNYVLDKRGLEVLELTPV